MRRRKRVAFVCLAAYPLFEKHSMGKTGGMETRSALFARGVAATKRWKVTFAVGDYGQDRRGSADGIDLILYRPVLKPIQDNIVPRFQKHRWRPVVHLDKRDLHLMWELPLYLFFTIAPKCLFNRFWKSERPDVVCCFGNNPVSAEVIADCYREGIKTILCIASDNDLADYRPGDRTRNDYGTPCWMAWYAIKTTDLVMVQTERQQKLLEERFQRSGIVIPNPVAVPPEAKQHWRPRHRREFALWIGRSDTFNKRPLLVLELARVCPDIAFVMIVNRTNQNVFDTLTRECSENVRILEHVPHREIMDYFHRARVFLSTSLYEGFPNTFLQAAVSGVPVASLQVDPANIFARAGCGLLANGDFAVFSESARALWENDDLAERIASNFYEYVVQHHRLEDQVPRFEDLLEKVIADARSSLGPGCWRKPFSRFVTRAAE